MKEREKKDKYLDITRELKKLWTMKTSFVPIVIGALSTPTKGLIKGLYILTAFGDGVSFGRGCLTWVPEKPRIDVTQLTLLEPQEVVSQAQTLLRGARLIA